MFGGEAMRKDDSVPRTYYPVARLTNEEKDQLIQDMVHEINRLSWYLNKFDELLTARMTSLWWRMLLDPNHLFIGRFHRRVLVMPLRNDEAPEIVPEAQPRTHSEDRGPGRWEDNAEPIDFDAENM